MKIELDGKEYTVSHETEEKMVQQIYLMLLEKYEGLGKTIRLLVKPVARQILLEMEKKSGKGIRPPRGDDPTLHLVRLMLGVLNKGLQDVECQVTTKRGSTEITTFGLSVKGQGESGRPLAFNGDEREWQDDGGEDVRQQSSETLSNITSLHPGHET
jgi:hypothetical protein